MPAESNTDGPVLFAYDGSDHAKAAIEEAGRQLRTGRAALVLTVWEPLESIPFMGAPWTSMPAGVMEEIAERALQAATEGAELARTAGFDAQPLADRGTPVWTRIVELADENKAAIVVLGSHGRTGLRYVLMGSVATAVAHHVKRPVMISRLAT
jgi:nucleotide-binding universal stress UspA family protein